MTDTARTLAAIKALFADNSVGAISPQDLRDFVQSLVDPVAAGGFDGLTNQVALVRHNGAGLTNGLYRVSDMTVISAVPAGQTNYYALPILKPDATDTDFSTPGNLYDPNGWILSTSVVDPVWWGATLPAYTVFSLPHGYYEWTFRMVLLGTSPADSWDVYFDQVGDYSTFSTHIKEDYPFRRTDSGATADGQRLSGEEAIVSGSFYLPDAAKVTSVLQVFGNTNARTPRTFEIVVTRVSA